MRRTTEVVRSIQDHIPSPSLWRTIDNIVPLPDTLTQTDRDFLVRKAFVPAGYCPEVPLLLLDPQDEFNLWPFERERFEKDHVLPLGSQLVTPGEDLPFFDGEGTYPNLLKWEEWYNEMKAAEVPGLELLTLQYVVTHFLVAYRDDPSRQVASRAFSIASRWRVTDDEAFEMYGLGKDSYHVTVLSDAIDGIGYSIGADMRKGVANYSEQTAQNIAHATARGTTMWGRSEMAPEPWETVFKGVSIPGRLYDSKGRLKASVSDKALVYAGLIPHQYRKPDYKLYTDVKANWYDAKIYNPAVARAATRYGFHRNNNTIFEKIRNVRRRINAKPQPPHLPDPPAHLY